MSSMTKVMQKIRAEGPDPGPAEAPDTQPASMEELTPAAETAGAETPVAEGPSPEGASAFVEGPPAESEPGSDRDPRVVEDEAASAGWDTRRIDPVVVAFHDRYSAICEQYRSVRARLHTMNTPRSPQVIAITSAIPEEGKSVSAINLSLIMAEGGEHRILLADADFRRTSVARMLGLKEGPGLAEALRGECRVEDVLQPTPFPNMNVLVAGKVHDNAYGELMGGPNTEAVLDELRAKFDYTFLDTPPITTVSDVCLLAPRCDGAMVVVQMRRTPEPTVQQAVRTLQANNVKILGALLSRFRERGSGYYDYHYYSSYYYR